MVAAPRESKTNSSRHLQMFFLLQRFAGNPKCRIRMKARGNTCIWGFGLTIELSEAIRLGENWNY